MADVSVFDYADYKVYLNAFIRARDERGYKSRIAKALKCDLGYVSRVLNGSAHFSLEQADDLNTFFSHAPLESQFFLLLVSRERAGTASLRAHFKNEIERALEKRLTIQNRILPTRTLTEADQARYYSSWLYSAIHLMLAIPAFQTASAIQNELKLSSKKVHEILAFLVHLGVAKQEKNHFVITSSGIHLGKDSPFIAQHHTNWRNRAVDSLESENPLATHYSSVISIGKEDLPKVNEILIGAIETIRKVVRTSGNETVWCYALDWFPVVKEGRT